MFAFAAIPFVSFLGVIWALVNKFYLKEAILGWTSQITAILFLGSVQLICIAMVGEYLVRIYEEVKERPYYIISQAYGIEKPETKPDSKIYYP